MDAILIIGLGFTGKQVLEYLSKHPDRHTYALQAGGRSPSKIAATIADVGAPDVEVVVFDLANYLDVEKAVLGCTVVINCAGPFFRHGGNVIEACARHGRHYADISGETWWQAEMINKYDFLAWKRGACIVPGSCFDSIPSDASAYTSVKTIKAILGPKAKVGKCTSAFRVKGGFSGGTADTVMASFNEVPRHLIKRGSIPHVLSPVKGLPPRKPQLIYKLPNITHKPIIGGYFLMNSTNTNIVRRTWGLLQSRAQTQDEKNFAYGETFDYDEFMQLPSYIAAAGISLAILFFALFSATLPPFRWFMRNFILPKSGEGPGPEDLKSGFFTVTNVATSAPTVSSPRSVTVRTVLTGHGDPGYLLGAANREKLTRLGQEGGILTPMSAFGSTILDRLLATGKFEISSGELLNGGATGSQ